MEGKMQEAGRLTGAVLVLVLILGGLVSGRGMVRDEPAAAQQLPREEAAPVQEPQQPDLQKSDSPEPNTADPEQMFFSVELADGSLAAMEQEDYLTGVLLAELPGSFHPEAKRAQAVASRTYALGRVGRGRHTSGADLCVNPGCCQGWQDPASWPNPEEEAAARAAVRDTRGQVLTWQGNLIDATFFSCSGGRTEAAAAVWGAEVPYLQPVDSPGEQAPHNADTVWIPIEEAEAALGITLSGPPDTWLGPVTRTAGGGVDTWQIGGETFTGPELRRLLGLRSADFDLTADPAGLTASTRGYGHRVGLSQYGAQAMAEAGANYREILMHYYTGVEVGPP